MSKRVLIVEDGAGDASLARELRSVGRFEVLCADTAREGVRLARTQLPDMILIDMALMGGSALTAVEQLKENPVTRHIPIAALTTNLAGDADRAAQAGCDLCLARPVRSRELLGVVLRYTQSANGVGDGPALWPDMPTSASGAFRERAGDAHTENPEDLLGYSDPQVPTVLVAMDNAEERAQAEYILEQSGCRLRIAYSGLEALAIAQGEPLHLAVISFALRDMVGYEVAGRLSKEARTSNVPILVAIPPEDPAARSLAFSSGANDVIYLPLSEDELSHRARCLIQWHAACEEADHVRRDLEKAARTRTARMRQALQEREDELAITRDTLVRLQRETVDSLALAAEQFRGLRHIEESRHHLDCISAIAGFIVRDTGMTDEEITKLQLAVRLHDVGNLYLPDRLCLRSENLNAMEVREWQQHTQLGSWFMARLSTDVMTLAREIAYHHHERWDGEGFPQHLRGEQIPFSARVCALAHGIDDLMRYGGICDTGPAPMQPVLALSPDAVNDYLVAQRKRRYDPDMVDTILVRREEFLLLLDRLMANRGKTPDPPRA